MNFQWGKDRVFECFYGGIFTITALVKVYKRMSDRARARELWGPRPKLQYPALPYITPRHTTLHCTTRHHPAPLHHTTLHRCAKTIAQLSGPPPAGRPIAIEHAHEIQPSDYRLNAPGRRAPHAGPKPH